MKNALKCSRITKFVLVAILLWSSLGTAQAQSDAVQPTLPQSIETVAQGAQKTGGIPCMSSILNEALMPVPGMEVKNKINFKGKGNIRAIIGGRNFTPGDIDLAEVPFYTPANGVGANPLLHDGGDWPGTGGNPSNDDGRSTLGVDQAGEIYDLDKNGHYPKAVLRYIGAHCYIFVPVMMFPTLPRGISNTEETTPAANSAWGMYWPDTRGWGGDVYYYAPATGAKTLEPRFVLGSDKNLARLKLKELADEFDANIYPKTREYFGNEPDADGDAKVFILLDDIRDGVGSYRGYVWKANQLPNSVYSLSNEKEIIHLDLFPTFILNPKQGYRTMAHEFTHLIAFAEGNIVTGSSIDQQPTWLEEGWTQYASFVYDKSHTTNADEFIKKPDTPLTKWNNSVPFANYGASYMWIFYLMEHYGRSNPQTFMRNMVRAKTRGVQTINDALKGFGKTFSDAFGDWAISNILDKTRKMDGSPLNEGKWGYFIDNDFDITNDMGVNEKLPVKFSERVILGPAGAVRSSQVNSTAADYVELSGNSGNVNIGFDGEDNSQFSAAIVKRGPQVDPTVEFISLDEKQKGNLIIQNYGAGNSYENLILVPMITSDANGEAGTYVFSASFADLKVAMFPNPVFENQLHVLIRTTDKFAATPRLQMTYNEEQGYLTMTPVTDNTYITNYQLKNSGEGTIEAYGTTANGQILANRLKFSAVYYPPRSSSSLSASFGSLEIPSKAMNKGGYVTMAANQNKTSYPGLLGVSPEIDVILPVAATDLPITMKFPAPALPEELKSSPLGLFEIVNDGIKLLARVENSGATLTTTLSKPGKIFLAADTASPVLQKEAETIDDSTISVRVKDLGSGVDPESVNVLCNGNRVPARFDANSQRVIITTSRLPRGTGEFEVSLSDRLGNKTLGKISAQVAGPLTAGDVSVYPSPARAFAKFRCVFSGSSSLTMGIEATVLDVHGDEVYSTNLSHKGSGVYETTWNLHNDDGKTVSNGVYYLKIKAYGDGRDLTFKRKFAVLQ